MNASSGTRTPLLSTYNLATTNYTPKPTTLIDENRESNKNISCIAVLCISFFSSLDDLLQYTIASQQLVTAKSYN